MMQRVLVVFESMFGNTQAVARAVTDGLSTAMEAELVDVGHAPAAVPEGNALLVIGGPTHAFGMSRSGTRQSAAERTDRGVVTPGYGLREWLEGMGKNSPHRPAAAFDTRIDKHWVPGSAAGAAAKRLRRLGFDLVVPPQDFYVTDMEGPLVDGELERAHAWGVQLAELVTARAGSGR